MTNSERTNRRRKTKTKWTVIWPGGTYLSDGKGNCRWSYSRAEVENLGGRVIDAEDFAKNFWNSKKYPEAKNAGRPGEPIQ